MKENLSGAFFNVAIGILIDFHLEYSVVYKFRGFMFQSDKKKTTVFFLLKQTNNSK